MSAPRGGHEGRWQDTQFKKDESDPEKKPERLWSRAAVPENYLNTVKQTLEAVAQSNNYHTFAKQIIDKGWVKLNKRIFDNAKISDHFAIIPTSIAPKNLSEPEQKLYDLAGGVRQGGDG